MAHGLATPTPTMTPRPALRPQRRVVVWAAIGVLVLVALVAELGWWRLTATRTDFAGSHFNLGQNATWLAHTWVGDQHSDSDYAALASLLKREQIAYVYAHVGPTDSTGVIPTSLYPYAGDFASALHADDPSVKILAWVGSQNSNNALAGSSYINISLPATQQNIANTAAIFTDTLGFDGVHLDIEPVLDNDPHFLDLLDLTRQAIGSDKILSIATPNWVPIARASEFIDDLTDHPDNWWTTYYFQSVSHHVDQIVVMLYDTSMPTAPLYEALVQQETNHVLRDIQLVGTHASVLIGIPTYIGPTSRAFHASAENMRTGLTGVINGLNMGSNIAAFSGVAIYPEWVTTGDDWATYNDLWLGTGS